MVQTVDMGGMLSFKSSAIMNQAWENSAGYNGGFGATTKASYLASALSPMPLKGSALTPASMFRGTFLNHIESSTKGQKERRQSSGKLAKKDCKSIQKQMRIEASSPPMLRVAC